jgi:hypothetical protein
MGRKRQRSRATAVAAYLDDIAKLAEAGEIKRGEIQHVEVLHESCCAQLRRTGPCNCKPDVRVLKPQ